MLKTIIIICFVLVVNSQSYKPIYCEDIDNITKNIDLGLKLSKINEEYLTFNKLQKDLKTQNLRFQTVITFIKTLKKQFDDKVLLQISQLTRKEKEKKQQDLTIRTQAIYDLLGSGLSEIRAISRMFPEIEKAQHSFQTMTDQISKFQEKASHLNLDKSKIDGLLYNQLKYKNCKEKKYVLEPNIYESSSSDEEETPNESKDSSSPKVTPQVSPQVSPKVSPKVSPQVQPQVPPQASPKRPLGPQKSQIKYDSKHLKAHKQVKGHLKHNSRHQKQNLISVQNK